jgi:hypothetical protein
MALTRMDLLMPSFASLDEAQDAGPVGVIVPLRWLTSAKQRRPAHESGRPAKGA